VNKVPFARDLPFLVAVFISSGVGSRGQPFHLAEYPLSSRGSQARTFDLPAGCFSYAALRPAAVPRYEVRLGIFSQRECMTEPRKYRRFS
jgi:hypothetical protein